MSHTLNMDFEYTTTAEKLWSALTDSKKLARWTLKNDFLPVVGHQFTFRDEPSEWWDGIVTGEVVAVEPPTRLSYTWGTGDERHTVVWTLNDLGNGKVNLHLEQSGISSQQALGGAKYGWLGWTQKLETLLQE